MIVLCFVVLLCVRSSFAIILLVKGGWMLCFVFLVSRGCCVALPCGAIGLSAVCDCGISWSYSLFLTLRLSRSRST